MRVALSIPDGLFKQAEAAAKEMNVSRSQLYAMALAQHLEFTGEGAMAEALKNSSSHVDSRLKED